MNELKKYTSNEKLELISYEKNVSKDLLSNVYNGTQISVLKKEKGNEFTVKTVAEIIKSINDQFNFTNKMNNDQIVNAAIAVIEDYWILKIEELIYFSKNVLKGKYGKIFQSFDQLVLFELLNEYDRQRSDELERVHQNSKSQSTKNIKELSTVSKEMLGGMIARTKTLKKTWEEKLNDIEFKKYKHEEAKKAYSKKMKSNQK
ncbi:MAG: hypothetical protein HOB88_06330 [Bacteroidetes bacterium]|jgi:hypothetical protein|nr:hypothetical protein [Bacteroidota bacterium]